jgi:acyl transferase domain-containing protein
MQQQLQQLQQRQVQQAQQEQQQRQEQQLQQQLQQLQQRQVQQAQQEQQQRQEQQLQQQLQQLQQRQVQQEQQRLAQLQEQQRLAQLQEQQRLAQQQQEQQRLAQLQEQQRLAQQQLFSQQRQQKLFNDMLRRHQGQQSAQINYNDIFLTHYKNSCYYNSALQLILNMPEICDIIMHISNNNQNLLYKIINFAKINNRIVSPTIFEKEYKECIAGGVEWGRTNPIEIQLSKLLEFDNVNNTPILDLVMGDEKWVDERRNEGVHQRMPIMVLNQPHINMNTIEGLIAYNKMSSNKFYTLNKDQKYVIINLVRPALSSSADQTITLNEIKIQDKITIDNKIMELKGFIYYNGNHYVFISKEDENKWSLYDDLKSDIIRMTSPLYNGENVKNKSIIYLYKIM